MTRMILLDIDDCLSSDRSILACRDFDEASFVGYRVPRLGDRVAIDLVNRACTICDAKIVIISAWLDVAGPRYTLDWLTANGLLERHLAPDPVVDYGPSGSKREAVDDWRARHPDVPADHVVAVDDDVDLFPADNPLADRQVVVDGEDGILLRHYREIVTRLGGSDRRAGIGGPDE